MQKILLFIIVFLAVSCSTQNVLRRTYIGQPVSTMEMKFGEAKTVFDQKDGKIYVFEREKKLKSTEISQGKLTLDPVVTPMVTKTEKYYVTVKDNIIQKIKLESEYERKEQ